MFLPLSSSAFFIFNPAAPNKAKIVCNFGLSECNRVKLSVQLLRNKNSTLTLSFHKKTIFSIPTSLRSIFSSVCVILLSVESFPDQ